MMSPLFELLKNFLFAALMAYILIPILRRIAVKTGLVDIPGSRKIHQKPIPLVGGIAITLSTGVTLLLSPYLPALLNHYSGICISTLILFVAGVLDDRFDIKAKYKFVIQMVCAYTLTSYGIRITSFYGLFGIYNLSEVVSYTITILLITGTVNAFNLMDGIDGLAGGLSILGFSLFFVIGVISGHYLLSAVCAPFIGALIVFLKNNFSSEKIFMGDSGSLFLGFILIALGIKVVEHQQINELYGDHTILLIIVAFFAIPVIDSLRVYRGRIRNGYSPFRADKTHLHHKFLSTGLKHKRISTLIVVFVLILITLIAGYNHLFTLTLALGTILTLYLLLTGTLNMIIDLKKWREKIKQIEK